MPKPEATVARPHNAREFSPAPLQMWPDSAPAKYTTVRRLATKAEMQWNVDTPTPTTEAARMKQAFPVADCKPMPKTDIANGILRRR